MFFSSRDSDSHRLATRAAEQASALDCSGLGPEHLLLALLGPEEDSPASHALRASGAEHDKLREAVRAEQAENSVSGEDDASHGVSPTAGTYQMIGRAEGLATGLGESVVSAEHLLLALLLYNSDSYIALRLDQAGGSRETAWRELQHRGVHAPHLDLPPLEGESLAR